MKRKLMFAFFAAALSAAAFGEANAQAHFGLRGGLYMDQDEGFVGAHALTPIQRNWVFSPNFEYVFVETGSYFTINADLHYDFPSRSNTIFYLGGGLGISHSSFEETKNTDAGVNLLTGISFSRRPIIPFIQAKVMMGDVTQLILGGGLTF
ncbi:MAG: hypothetical protein ACREOO_09840 [bacterium]